MYTDGSRSDARETMRFPCSVRLWRKLRLSPIVTDRLTGPEEKHINESNLKLFLKTCSSSEAQLEGFEEIEVSQSSSKKIYAKFY